MSNFLNNAFENIHPQIKISFTEIEPAKYDVSITFYDSQGEFLQTLSRPIIYSKMQDERFPAMVEGSAKALSIILAGEADLTAWEGYPIDPNELIIDFILSDKSLTSIDDFVDRLNSISARQALQIQEYIFNEVQRAGIDPECFSESEEKALILLGSFYLSYEFPSIEELSVGIRELVHNPQIWPLLAIWIKEWADSSNWSYDTVWEGGPSVEEILAKGTYILLKNTGDSVKKQEWWHELTLIFDIGLDFSNEALKRSGFII